MRLKKIMFFSFLALTAVLVSGCTIKIGNGKATAVDGGVFKSTDGGQVWAQVASVPSSGGKIASIANVDIRRMVFDPSDYNTIYLSTEKNGVIYTNDSGANWHQFKQFVGAKINAVAIDPNDKCNLYVLYANKIYKSTDCGRFWDDIYVHQNTGVILSDIVVDYVNSSIVYITTNVGEILRSNDGGSNWATVNRVNKGVFLDLVMDAKDSRIVYAATQKSGVYKTTDSGKTWNSLGDGLKAYSGSQEYKGLIISPSVKDGLILISKFGMLRTSDGGANWEVVELLPASKQTTIYSVAVNPKDSSEIYYATRTTLVKSVDSGKTWSSQALPTSRIANRLIINPDNPLTIYLGTSKPSEK
ncbi:MAG: YCF48-related protein [Candidatus Buchananbacteria bacterium]|nr:YCF48-related protein [Candidatus Buchananbacteria bacterium]